MATDNEWLRLLYIQITKGGTGGVSLNQAQVTAAIEAAVNIDGLESLITVLSAAVDQANDVFNNRDSWRSLNLTTASASYSSTSTGFEHTVPASKEWQFQSGYLPFAAGGTAANRVLRAYFSAGGGFAGVGVSRVTQTAGQTRYYNLGLFPSLDSAVDTQYIYVPVPPLILGAGDKIGVTVPAFASGDAFTNPIVKVLERAV